MAILVRRLLLRNGLCAGIRQPAARSDRCRLQGTRAVFSEHDAAAGVSDCVLISMATSVPALTATVMRRSSSWGKPTGPDTIVTPTSLRSEETSAISVPDAGAVTCTRRQTEPTW